MKETERRRRQFIRAYHPDRGGDAATFIAGMHAFDAEAPPEPPPRVVIVRHRAWLTRLVTAVAGRVHHGRKLPRVR